MFAAIFMRQPGRDPRDLVAPEALEDALSLGGFGDVRGHWCNDRVLMAQSLLWNTPESKHEAVPEVCSETGRVIVSWVRLDNREELCSALGLEERQTLTDPQIILAAYRKWGEECSDRLEGDFSFVIYDPNEDRLFACRDTIGARPLFFGQSEDAFFIATTAGILKDQLFASVTRSHEWCVRFLMQMTWDPWGTAFEEIKKLPPAHSLSVPARGDWTAKRFFEFSPASASADRRDSKWVDAYRDLFDRVMADRARSAFLIASEASGGLDSSSITATLPLVMRQPREDLHTFGLCDFEDEVALILATQGKHGIRHSHIMVQSAKFVVTPGYSAHLNDLGYPPEYTGHLFHEPHLELAQQFGIRTMFSGFGGDELITNQAVGMVNELLQQGRYRTALRELGGSMPRQVVRLTKRVRRLNADYANPWYDWFDAIKSINCLSDASLSRSDLGDRLLKQLGPSRVRVSAVNKQLLNEPALVFAASLRTEASSVLARRYGMEYVWPLLDRRLMIQFLKTPVVEKRSGNMGRYLHRRAMAGRVPEEILRRPTKHLGAYLNGGPKKDADNLVWFDELPSWLQEIIDHDAFEHQARKYRDSPAALGDETNRRAFYFWQIKQMQLWADRHLS
ncbi:asparagine synthase-related protein [Shimia ponticola]|uniref:asparagine synthase-related protein n=1 Tax=Shimia ponticola TaxID=2582893 RepID=UPI0011BDC42C|nr:asparagine synthase-related protein [Shimia ponticola]